MVPNHTEDASLRPILITNHDSQHWRMVRALGQFRFGTTSQVSELASIRDDMLREDARLSNPRQSCCLGWRRRLQYMGSPLCLPVPLNLLRCSRYKSGKPGPPARGTGSKFSGDRERRWKERSTPYPMQKVLVLGISCYNLDGFGFVRFALSFFFLAR